MKTDGRKCNRGHWLELGKSWCGVCDANAPGWTSSGQRKNITHQHLLDRTSAVSERLQNMQARLDDIHYRVSWLQTPPQTVWVIKHFHRYVQTLILILILLRVW